MAKEVIPGVFRIGGAGSNAFLLAADELVLIDTHLTNRLPKLLDAVREAGRTPLDVHHIAVTHYHTDHAGSLAAAAKTTGGRVYAHAADADLLRTGGRPPVRPIGRGKVVLPVFWAVLRNHFEGATVDQEVSDGDEIGSTGLRVIHTPGHTMGHVSFLWPERGGVLFVGDAVANDLLRLNFGYAAEDIESSKRSLRKLAGFDFETALFGHGRTITSNASTRFRREVDRLAG